MRQFPHVKRNHRSGNWTYFRRFPKEVRPIEERTFFERSLRTPDRRELHKAWNDAHAEFQSIVDRALVAIKGRASVHTSASQQRMWTDETDWPTISRADNDASWTPLELDLGAISQAIATWGHKERYNRAQRLLNDPTYVAEDRKFAAECEIVGAGGIARNWVFFSPQLYNLTTKIMEENNIRVPAWHGALYAIERMVEAELRKTLNAEGRWRDYDLSDMPSSPSHSESANVAPNNKPYIELSVLADRYIETTRKPKKTASKLRMVVRYINDIAGGNLTIDHLSKDILLKLQTDGLLLPARPKHKEKNLGFAELVEIQRRVNDGRPRLTSQAIRSWFNLLGGCLNWAVAADLLSRNPTNGIKPKTSALTEGRRTSFTLEDLRCIFSADQFGKLRDETRYWIPLLALFTGARLNEIGQLLTCDVKFDPSPHLTISDVSEIGGAKKRLKNISSRRVIPLHGTLLSLGFIDFVKRNKGVYLFSDLPHNSEYEPTKAFSQWFGRYLRSVRIENRAKVFHSFRHTFKDACRSAGIDEEVHDALTGHRNQKHVGRAYGEGVPYAILERAIHQIQFDLEIGLPPSHTNS